MVTLLLQAVLTTSANCPKFVLAPRLRSVFFFLIFIVIQLQLYAFSPLPSEINLKRIEMGAQINVFGWITDTGVTY